MVYAPVAITTLNRYEHIKKCLESLDKCNWADKTDVFVALDFPPSEKYVEGYKKVKDYLETANFCFNSFTVIKRERNYGFGIHGNSRELLVKEIWPQYDRVIISEDDNVFSPTFLQFIDYNLEVCSKREDIMGVGGYTIPANWKDDGLDTVLLNSNANAWGYGILRDRYNEFASVEVNNYYHEILSSKERRKRLLSGSNNDCGGMAWYVMNGNDRNNDTFKSIYLRDKKKYYLFPKISQVYNNGTDGSGQSSGKVDTYGYSSVKMDTRNDIDLSRFDMIPEFYERETISAINSFYNIPMWKMVWIKFVFRTHKFWKNHSGLGKFMRKAYIRLNPRL